MRRTGIDSLLVIASFTLVCLSFWHRNDLPGSIEFVPRILDAPRQSPTRREPFETVFENVRYRVLPEYEYDLTGMIVSYRHHDGRSRMHRRSNDHLNMLDVCVVWGDNTANPFLDRIEFWNGIFTCNASTRDSEAWQAFDIYQLANNHLISADDRVRREVAGVRVGDQIRVRGFLAGYGAVGGAMRGTSTTRSDSGDGACETLYVEKFEILRPAYNAWRTAMWISLAVLGFALVRFFRRPYRPYA